MTHWKIPSLLFVLAALTACSPSQDTLDGHLQKAREFQQAHDFEAAKLEYNNALKVDENNSEALFGIAQILEKEGSWYRAQDFLRKIVEVDPGHLDARVYLTNLYIGVDQIDRALVESEQLYKLAPERVDVKNVRAAVLYKIGNETEARELIAQVLAQEPNNVDALVLQANDLLTQGKLEEALSYLDRGLTDSPNDIVLNVMKIQALNRFKDLSRVVPVYEHLMALFPDNRSLAESLANQYFVNGDYAQSVAVLEKFARDNNDTEAFFTVVELVGRREGAEAAKARLNSYIEAFPQLHKLRFALADFYVNGRDLAAAEAQVQYVIDHAGDDAPLKTDALNRLARIKLAGGETEAAGAVIEQILSADATNPKALTTRANLQIQAGEPESAVRSLRLALRHYPDSPELLLTLGRAHDILDQDELANQYYAQAYKASQKGQLEALVYAEFLANQQRFQEAEQVLQPLIDSPLARKSELELYARVKLRQGDWEGVQKVADRLEQMGDGVEVARIRSLAYLGKQDREAAIESLHELNDIVPDNFRTMAVLVDTYLKADNRVGAEQFLKNAIDNGGDSVYGYLLYGSLHMYYREWAAAEGYFRKAIEIKPDTALAYNRLAQALSNQNKLEDAESVLKNGLAQSPNNVSANLLYAGLLERQQRYDESIALYEKLLEKTESLVVINNLAVLLHARGGDENLDRALALAEKLKNSNIPHFLDTLGWLYVAKERYPEAVKVLETAAERLPGSGELRFHLATARFHSGDRAGAKAALDTALELSQGGEPWLQEAKALQELIKNSPES